MVKVYGYYRCGNNLLIQTLIKNFDFGDVSQMINSASEYQRFKETFTMDKSLSDSYKLTNKNGVWNHPYAKLGGGHGITKNHDVDGIYIVRNPMDVMSSLHKLKASDQIFEDWCTVHQLDVWKNHVNHMVNSQKYFYIKYEDLRDNFKPTIQKIQQHFNLTQLNDEYLQVDKLVGWKPKKGVLEGRSRTSVDFSEKMNNLFEPYIETYKNLK